MEPNEDPTVQTTIYLPASLRAWVEAERREHNLTLTLYIRQLIERQRDRMALVRELGRQLASGDLPPNRYGILDAASLRAFERAAWGTPDQGGE